VSPDFIQPDITAFALWALNLLGLLVFCSLVFVKAAGSFVLGHTARPVANMRFPEILSAENFRLGSV
jgi:hypothetical protein